MLFEAYSNGLKEFSIRGESSPELTAELRRYLAQYNIDEVIAYYDNGDNRKYDIIKMPYLKEQQNERERDS